MSTMQMREASARPGEVQAKPPSLLGRLLQVLPTLLVLAILGGLAYWGHHTGWRLPKFSELAGKPKPVEQDWCSAHSVPESICVECNPELLPAGKKFGWCNRHGIPECPLCHPEVAQLSEPSAISEADRVRAERALAIGDRPTNSKKCKKHERHVQVASEETMRKLDIEPMLVRESAIIESIPVSGEVTYDQTRLARLSARLPGSVWQVDRHVGDAVRAGDVLALVDAADVGRAKSEFLQAFAQVELKSKLLEGMRNAGTGILGARTLQEAEAALRESRIRLLSAQQTLVNLGLPIQADQLKDMSDDRLTDKLQFLGLPESLTSALDRKTTTANLLPIKAPLDGVVVGREAVAGEVVDTAKVLFTIADVRRMWLTLDVKLEDARHVALGQEVLFQPDGMTRKASGKIDWISTSVNEKTRTVKVRAGLDNREGKLRANTFGAGRIILREEDNAVVVPSEAVQWEGDCQVVFVRDKNFSAEDAPKVFHVRKVRTGAKTETETEIIAGLLPGEWVAARGARVLCAELLKNSMAES